MNFDLFWLQEVFSRHWSKIVSVFLVVFILGLILFLWEPPLYLAEAKIKIEQRKPVFDFEEFLSFESVNEAFYTTQLGVLQSRTIAYQVLENVGMSRFDHIIKTPGFFEGLLLSLSGDHEYPASATPEIGEVSSPTARLVDEYLNILSIKPERMSPQIIRIGFMVSDPEFAASIVNRHAEFYIDYSRKGNALFTDDYIEGLNKQLVELEKQIIEHDKVILKFKEENEFFQIQGMSSFDPVQDIDDRLSRTRQQLSMAMETVNQLSASYESLFEPGKIGQWEAIREEVISTPALEIMRQKRTDYLQEWADIQERYRDNHPEYIRVRNQLDILDNAMTLEVERQVERAKSAFEEALSIQSGLVEQEQNFIQEKYRRDAQWRHLKNLEQAREQLIEQKGSILKDLQNAKGSLETQKQTRNRVFEILDPAEIPLTPINRKWSRILLLTLAAAISAALTGGLLLEFQDRTIRTPQQIEQLTHISVIGCIPRFEAGEFSKVEGRLHDYELTPAGEAFIALRTRFLFSDLVQQTQSILVTSSISKEGKSTICVNLASSIALVGRRVVLVECDLRKPILHRFFGEMETPGLMDVVKGVETLDHALVETDIPGLFLLPAGSPHAHPSEILSSLTFDEIIRTLKEEFDYVILDSPPLLSFTDAAILSPKIDISLLVARCGRTVQEDLLSSIEHIGRSGGEVFSIVLNDVPQSERSAYMRYGYGYTKQDLHEAATS